MSSESGGVDLVLLWHHHQPDYRSPREGRSLLPWVRLHATKDYLDMARRLERHPGVRMAFNFVPSLLDQLDDAVAGTPDALFDVLARPAESLVREERAEVAARCCAAPPHAFERWPRYRALCHRMARARREGRASEATEAELLALECWFLLAWVDPMFFDEPEASRALSADGEFLAEHRDDLLALHARLLSQVVPAYRALAGRGQVELSESPYYHPILPLLVGLRSARRARPDLPLPNEEFAAPEDAARQVERALERHALAFGARPAGMWPSEGGVSPEAAEIVARSGVRWIATDEGVLWNSSHAGDRQRECLYRPWVYETPAGPVHVLFRDRELSDRIGFVYHRWSAAAAVDDFISRLRRIGREAAAAQRPVVSVILDGENCWENFPDDGGPFLDQLYRALEQSPDIRTRTPSEVIADTPAGRLDELHSGSWIDADFHIWIGHPEKNRAWELVARARRALVEGGFTPERQPQAWESLSAAEGSDWFWWFGDDHYTADKQVFDRIFREHLQAVYERVGLDVPAWLQVPVARLSRPRDVRLQPLGFVRPVMDGRPTHFYEWYAAGRYRLGAGGGTMHRTAGLGQDLFLGFDPEQLFLRLDFADGRLPGEATDLQLEVLTPLGARIAVQGLARGRPPVVWSAGPRAGEPVAGADCVVDTVVELAVPFASLGLGHGDQVEILAQLARNGEPLESLPSDDLLRFSVPHESFEASMWSA